MLLIAQAISLLVTAAGALLGTVFEFKRDGQVTGTGWVAAALVVLGLSASAIALVLNQREKKAAAEEAALERDRADEHRRRLESQNMHLISENLQEKSVRKIALGVGWQHPDGQPLNCAVISVIRSRNGQYFFVMPSASPIEGCSFHAEALRLGSDGKSKRIPGAAITFVNNLATISLSRAKVLKEDWLIDVAADINEARHYIAVPAQGDSLGKTAARRALSTVTQILILANELPIHSVPQNVFSQGLILSRESGGELVSSGDFDQARFYMGPPNWDALAEARARSNDLAKIAASNTLMESAKRLGVEEGDIEVIAVEAHGGE